MSDHLTVHFVHPGNPFSPDPDGIVSVQRNFIGAAPDDMGFVYWGVRRPGVAATDGFSDGERLRFRAVISADTQRPVVPLSLRFAARMLRSRRRVGAGVLRFDRIESAVPFLSNPQPKAVFLHTWNTVDIRNDASESKWRWAAPLHDRLFDLVVRRADLVYVLRSDMAEHLARRLPDGEARLRRFGVPVDLSLFAPLPVGEREAVRAEICADLAIPHDARLVLFAGRLEGQKRPLTLPAVASALRREEPEVHVLVAGTGSLETDLAGATHRLAPGRLHLLGSIGQARLAGLMAAADALVLPSAFEGLPNVVLEALAAGTPVVAARHGGRTAEVLAAPHAGMVTGSEPSEMAAALRAVFARRGKGAAERRLLAERFSPEALNREIYEEFRRLGVRSKYEESGGTAKAGPVIRVAATRVGTGRGREQG